MVVRIVVGVDGSEPAQAALRWAVREALRRDSSLLVVSAYPEDDPAVGTGTAPHTPLPAHTGSAATALPASAGVADAAAPADATAPPHQAVRRHDRSDEWAGRSCRQRERIAAARHAVAPGAPLRVARQLGTEPPLTALVRAAATADLLVVGTHQPDQARSSLSGQLSQVMRARRLARSCPMVVVPAPGALLDSPGRTGPAAGGGVSPERDTGSRAQRSPAGTR